MATLRLTVTEPSKDEPGVFWLDAKGLERLFGSLVEWAAGLRAEIKRAGFDANLVVGFDRFAVRRISRVDLQAWRTTWAGRLAHGSARTVIRLDARAARAG